MDNRIDQHDLDLVLNWYGKVYENIETLPDDIKRNMIKSGCSAHYDFLNMDEVLDKCIGDIEGFVQFLQSEWNWIVKVNYEEKIILADENKNFCVCPLVKNKLVTSPTLCNCSEGIAEKMFSKVLQCQTTAKVIRSVLRGSPSCVYEIRW